MNLNTTVPSTQLLTGSASFLETVPISQVILAQSPLPRVITRLNLITTLTAADMVSATYWDGVGVQAPFYLFLGVSAPSNLQTATLIGSFNEREFVQPVLVPPFTDLVGYWLGVITASANKCQTTIHQRVL